MLFQSWSKKKSPKSLWKVLFFREENFSTFFWLHNGLWNISPWFLAYFLIRQKDFFRSIGRSRPIFEREKRNFLIFPKIRIYVHVTVRWLDGMLKVTMQKKKRWKLSKCLLLQGVSSYSTNIFLRNSLYDWNFWARKSNDLKIIFFQALCIHVCLLTAENVICICHYQLSY